MGAWGHPPGNLASGRYAVAQVLPYRSRALVDLSVRTLAAAHTNCNPGRTPPRGGKQPLDETDVVRLPDSLTWGQLFRYIAIFR